MEIVITLEREPGAPTVGIYSMDPGITVVRDASVSDRELLEAYAYALEEHNRDMPEILDADAVEVRTQ